MAFGLGGIKRNVLVKIVADSDTSEVQKVRAQLASLNAASDDLDNLSEAVDRVGEKASKMSDGADETTKSFSELTGQGLNLLFTGMALTMVFGMLAGGMLRFMGVAEPLGQMMGAALLPAFSMLVPHLFNLAEMFGNLPKPVRKFIGIFMLLMIPVGILIALIGALVLAATALGVSVATLGGIILGIIAVVAGLAAAITVLSSDKFPGLKNAIQAVIKFFKGSFKNFVNGLKNILGGIVDIFKGDVIGGIKRVLKGIGQVIFAPIKQAFDQFSLIEKAKSLGNDIIDGIVSAIKGAGKVIFKALNAITPGIPLDTIAGAIGNAAESVGDLVITSGGRVFKTASRDGLIATPNAQGLAEGGGGGQTTVNINDPVIKDEMDIDRVVDRVEDRINRDTRGRSGLP